MKEKIKWQNKLPPFDSNYPLVVFIAVKEHI